MLRSRLLRGVAAFGLVFAATCSGASAGDLPPSAEGLARVRAFFDGLTPTISKGSSPLSVEMGDGSYVVKLNMKMPNSSPDGPKNDGEFAMTYRLVEQGDGLWRASAGEMPRLKVQIENLSETIDMGKFTSTTLIDPKIAWFRAAEGAAERVTAIVDTPQIREDVVMTNLSAKLKGDARPDGAVSMSGFENFGAMTFHIQNKLGDGTPDVDFKMDALKVDLSMEGLKAKAALALWALFVAHPGRAEMAKEEAAVKSFLKEIISGAPGFDESVGIDKLTVSTPLGPVVIDALKVHVAAASGAAGPNGSFSESFAAKGLSLPASLVPANMRDLVPTEFDVGFKASGFDAIGAANEVVAALHLAGDGPPISDEDGTKLAAKLLGAGPIVIDIPPSHILAPKINATIDGKIYWAGSKPFGTVNIKVKNFDTTVAALKGLGPEVEKNLGLGVGLAKGLAKKEADGTLFWSAAIDKSGLMSVNGQSMGKAPNW